MKKVVLSITVLIITLIFSVTNVEAAALSGTTPFGSNISPTARRWHRVDENGNYADPAVLRTITRHATNYWTSGGGYVVCIDPGVASPGSLTGRRSNINWNSGIHARIARAYQIYARSDRSLAELRAFNVAIRAIYHQNSDINFGADALDGRAYEARSTTSRSSLRNGTTTRWYTVTQTARPAVAGYTAEQLFQDIRRQLNARVANGNSTNNFPLQGAQAAIRYFHGDGATSPVNVRISFDYDPLQSSVIGEDANNPNIVTRREVIRLSGLRSLFQSNPRDENAWIMISNLQCGNGTIQCTIEGLPVGSNNQGVKIHHTWFARELAAGEDSRDLVVTMTHPAGLTPPPSISFDWEYNNRFDVDCGVEIYDNGGDGSNVQRMIRLIPDNVPETGKSWATSSIHMSNTLCKGTFRIDRTVGPLPCEIRSEGADRPPIYMCNGRVCTADELVDIPHDELEYCCFLDGFRRRDLTDPNKISFFDTECNPCTPPNARNMDDVQLDYECPKNDSGDGTHTFIRQAPLTRDHRNAFTDASGLGSPGYTVIDVVEDLQSERCTRNSISAAVNNVVGLRRYRDNNYLDTGWYGGPVNSSAANNPYCQVYTSEQIEIHLPGVADVQSGRFFVFSGETIQPRIEGVINAGIHTNVRQWRIDYDNAIDNERETFNRWQEACAQHRNASGVCPGPWFYFSGQSINMMGTGETLESYVILRRSEYNEARNDRIRLEELKAACQNGTSTVGQRTQPNQPVMNNINRHLTVTGKGCQSFQDSWKYYLEPDVDFAYNQIFYETASQRILGRDAGQNGVLTPYFMQINYEAAEFWPNFTNDGSQQRDPNTGVSLAMISGSNRTYNAGTLPAKGSYGGGQYTERISFVPSTETLCTVGYEQVLYYRPMSFFYSLVPSGLVQNSHQMTTGLSATDVARPHTEIGHVFHVWITTYGGDYSTFFDIDNVGHLMRPLDSNNPDSIAPSQPLPNANDMATKTPDEIRDMMVARRDRKRAATRENSTGTGFAADSTATQGEQIPGVQQTIKEWFANDDHDAVVELPAFEGIGLRGECEINVTERGYESDCPECPPEDEDRWTDFWSPQFFYRTISLDEINPTGRANLGANWSEAKGRAAIERINNEAGGVVGGDIIFDPNRSDEFLEYRFVLGPTEMQEIRANDTLGSYLEFPAENWTCYFDNSKECQSNFLTELAANTTGSSLNGRNLWKYYFHNNGGWQVGQARPGGNLAGRFNLPNWAGARRNAYPRLTDINDGTNSGIWNQIRQGIWP